MEILDFVNNIRAEHGEAIYYLELSEKKVFPVDLQGVMAQQKEKFPWTANCYGIIGADLNNGRGGHIIGYGQDHHEAISNLAARLSNQRLTLCWSGDEDGPPHTIQAPTLTYMRRVELSAQNS